MLERVDMILLNDEEARQLSGKHSLPAAARAISALGPKAVVIKRGDAGALLFQGDDVFAAPAFPLDNVVDPTGAGDSFAGGFMGYLAAARRHLAGDHTLGPGGGHRAGLVLRRGLQPRSLPDPRRGADSGAHRRLRRSAALRGAGALGAR